jgi:hypothetical protein
MKRIVVLIALLALVFGGVAYATIPDSSGAGGYLVTAYAVCAVV